MNKTMMFVRLDYHTVRPYLTLKNLIIFIAVAGIMIFSSGEGASAMGILMMYGIIFSSYPFAVGEKNGIDALYPTLSIERKTVVKGRYMFTLCVYVCIVLLASVFSMVMLTLLGKEVNVAETGLTIIILLIIFSFIQAFQLPMFFKLGYEKAKLFAFLPFIGLSMAVLVLSNLLKDAALRKSFTAIVDWVSANAIITVLFIIIIWLVAVILSYKMSLKYYRRRDF